MKQKIISADEFDRIFDEGKEDIIQYLDDSGWRHSDEIEQEADVSLPISLIERVDKEAGNEGLARREIITRALNEYFGRVAL